MTHKKPRGVKDAIIGEMLRQWRVIETIEQRDLAADIGIAASSLCRLEKGKSLDMNSTVKLIEWLFRSRR